MIICSAQSRTSQGRPTNHLVDLLLEYLGPTVVVTDEAERDATSQQACYIDEARLGM